MVDRVGTVLTACNIAAVRRRTAALDRTDDLHLVEADVPGMGGTPSEAVGTLPFVGELIRCLRVADGLNTITRRAEIGTSSPVFGLRRMRWPFSRTTNRPNDDSFTVSPRSRQSVISWSTNSTREAASLRDRLTC
jgi:hypothetical protein